MKKFVNIRSLLSDYSRVYPLFFSVVFVLVLFQYSFHSMESGIYDAWIRYDLGMSHKSSVVIISMDEQSDDFLGERYPYTYATHERLLKRVIKDGPALINFFVNLPDGTDEQEGRFRTLINQYADQGGLFRFSTSMDAWGERLPPESLRDLGFSLGLVNIDNAVFAKDDVVRRAILTVSGNESIHLWTANQFRVRSGLHPLSINDIAGAYYNPEADAKFVRFRYFTNPIYGDGEVKRIPYHRVAVGNFPPGYFKGKIVLIGPSYLSRSVDFALTPFNTENYVAAKMGIHAAIIESLIQNKTIYPTSRYFGYFVALLLAVFLSVYVVRANPARALYVVMGTLCIVIASSFALFTLFGVWLNTIHFVLTIAAAFYIGIPFKAIDEYQRRFAIQEETKLLRKVENLKQNFISLMSHDLKTPVAKISGLADTMRRHAHGHKEIEEGIESIVESTRELNNFITSILDLTKVESRDISLNKVSEDVNSVIEQVVEEFRFETRSKSMEVVCELSPLYPIEIDHKLMKRVISNLVGNSIKYAGAGKQLTIKSWDDENWVYIEIADNGVGIPELDIEHIFEKFYRVKNDANHSIKGSGLGLYLVKYFIELHGGTISARSTVGEGTTFEIKLINA